MDPNQGNPTDPNQGGMGGGMPQDPAQGGQEPVQTPPAAEETPAPTQPEQGGDNSGTGGDVGGENPTGAPTGGTV